jgi:hypothetical protein
LLVSSRDLAARGIADGARVLVRSSSGTFDGTVRAAAIQEGNVQGFWPEVNVLLPHGPHDDSGVPDYGTEVTIEEVR